MARAVSPGQSTAAQNLFRGAISKVLGEAGKAGTSLLLGQQPSYTGSLGNFAGWGFGQLGALTGNSGVAKTTNVLGPAVGSAVGGALRNGATGALTGGLGALPGSLIGALPGLLGADPNLSQAFGTFASSLSPLTTGATSGAIGALAGGGSIGSGAASGAAASSAALAASPLLGILSSVGAPVLAFGLMMGLSKLMEESHYSQVRRTEPGKLQLQYPGQIEELGMAQTQGDLDWIMKSQTALERLRETAPGQYALRGYHIDTSPQDAAVNNLIQRGRAILPNTGGLSPRMQATRQISKLLGHDYAFEPNRLDQSLVTNALEHAAQNPHYYGDLMDQSISAARALGYNVDDTKDYLTKSAALATHKGANPFVDNYLQGGPAIDRQNQLAAYQKYGVTEQGVQDALARMLPNLQAQDAAAAKQRQDDWYAAYSTAGGG